MGDVLLMFLSSVEEHIFLLKMNQNADFDQKEIQKLSGCYPGPPRREGTPPPASSPSQPICLTPNIFDASPPLHRGRYDLWHFCTRRSVNQSWNQQQQTNMHFDRQALYNTALISLLHTVSQMLITNSYVIVIAMDFSKAFDTVRRVT